MKKQMISFKTIGLEILLISLTLIGLAQNNHTNYKNDNTDTQFEMMGIYLVNGFDPSATNLNLLLENRKDVHLKSAALNPIRLDSIIEFSKNGVYMEKRIWQYHYDSNNLLKSSDRMFYNVYNESMQIKEMRNYNESGQILSQVRTERLYNNGNDTIKDTYTEQNEYENGNLVKQQIKEWDQLGWYLSTTTYKYNEKNQIIKKEFNGTNGQYDQKRTNEYIYYPDNRIKYEVELTQWYKIAKKYEYQITDTSLVIQEKSTNIIKYTGAEALDKITKWNDGLKYIIRLDKFGRTASIISSAYNPYYKSLITNIKVEYIYDSTGKMEHASFFVNDLSDGIQQLVETTRIDNTYDDDNHIMEYKKTFFDALFNEWVVEESKTYYYNSIKSVPNTNSKDANTNTSIYPNPAIDCIHFSDAPELNSVYIICNQMGQIVDKGMITSQQIVVSHLKRGVYYLKTQKNGLPSVASFFKK